MKLAKMWDSNLQQNWDLKTAKDWDWELKLDAYLASSPTIWDLRTVKDWDWDLILDTCLASSPTIVWELVHFREYTASSKGFDKHSKIPLRKLFPRSNSNHHTDPMC